MSYLNAAAPPDGPATAAGHRIRTSPVVAAFANGCMREVLDYSDSNRGNLTHSGTPVRLFRLGPAYETLRAGFEMAEGPAAP